MNQVIDLENAVLRLIPMHQCVIVPELGAFILRKNPATVNKFTGELRCSGETIFFNQAIKNDDGILAKYLQENKGITYAEAINQINAVIQKIKEEINIHRNCRFGSIGNFFLNHENKLFFLPLGNLNIAKKAFGLPILKFASKEISFVAVGETQTPSTNESTKNVEIQFENLPKPETIEIIEPVEAQVIELENPELYAGQAKRSTAWKIAAAVAAISLAGTAYYYLMPLIGGKSENNDKPKASLAPIIKKKSNETIVTIPAIDPVKFAAKVEANSAIFLTEIKEKSGQYFLVSNGYLSEKLALKECISWKKTGIDACYTKNKNSDVYRVILGRYMDESVANTYSSQLPKLPGTKLSVRKLNIK